MPLFPAFCKASKNKNSIATTTPPASRSHKEKCRVVVRYFWANSIPSPKRSHHSDDEEFYIPFLLGMQNEQQLLERAAGWEYFSNLVRPHYGKGMEGKTPIAKLKELGYDLPE